jgi:DNA replication and repair protein RecF
MVLKKLTLKNFRNFAKKEFEFPTQTTLVVGKNASGKTNLLEAIFVLSSGHSFRGGKDEEMISYGKEISSIRGEVSLPSSGPGRPHKEVLEIILTKGEVEKIKAPKKRYLLNSVARRAMDFIGVLRVVIFRPEDLEIVIDSPATRRDYLDFILEQVDREYRRASLSYQKGLRQRNKLLEQIREGRRERSSLFFWDKLLVENGEFITTKREELILFINSQPDFFDDLEVKYEKSLVSSERLEEYYRQEVLAGMTLVGPHRDDFKIKKPISKRKEAHDLSIYGSRGEQRLAVFSLKLAELEFVTGKTNQRPVLLLDDIFSELDKANRERLLEVIPKQQTIITATDSGMIDKKSREKMKRVKL